MTRNKWIAAYLYYSGSLDEFLKKAVLPFVRLLEEKKTYKQFFFIRYFERGKHIRLRFKTDEFTSDNIIKPFLIDYFTDYFRNYPSVRIEPDWVKELPEENKLLPNNSIQFAEYEPEIERYGGPEGILISEKHFYICSETILNAINESEEWSYSKSMGIAIQLMVSFCFSMGMDIDTMIDFFEQYENMFIDAAIKSYFTDVKIENYKEYKSKITGRIVQKNN
jgi:thiopeptide-type bacteriocin biosynthesis protein